MNKTTILMILAFFLVWALVGWLGDAYLQCKYGNRSAVLCTKDITSDNILNPEVSQ